MLRSRTAATVTLTALSALAGLTTAAKADPPAATSGPQAPLAQAVPTATPAAPTVATEASPAPSPWAGTVELYGFAPLRTSGTTTVRGLSTDFDLDLGQVLRPLTGIATVRGSVEYGRVGLLTDLSYLSLQGAEGRTGNGFQLSRSLGPRGGSTASLTIPPRTLNANLGFIQGIYDLALRYRFGDRETAVARPGSFTVIPYAGVRFVNLQSNVGIELQGAGSNITLTGPRGRSIGLDGPARSFARYGDFSSTVAQPLLGTQAMVFLSPRLRLFARADIGGFALNNADDYSWNTQVGLGYAIGNSTQLNLSWRYLHLGGSNGATPQNAYLMNENGIEAGVKFFF